MNNASRQLENGRFAIQLLTREVEHAGFYDRFEQTQTPTAAPDPCTTDLATLKNDLGYAVFGYDAQDSSGFALPSCIPTANYRTGTDILVVRRVETEPTPVASLKPNLVYMQGGISGVNNYSMDLGSNSSAFNLTYPLNTAQKMPIRAFRVDIYFVSPCSRFDNNACQDSIPTLKRMELVNGSGSGISRQTVSLVDGIEDLQIYYGVDTNNDGGPDLISGAAYQASPGDASTTAGQTAWHNVVAVKLYLLARNIDSSPGHKDTKRYVLSPPGAEEHVVTGSDDAFKRHVYDTQIRLINRSSRREK
jgi:type IV pilus assembly protein PilW